MKHGKLSYTGVGFTFSGLGTVIVLLIVLAAVTWPPRYHKAVPVSPVAEVRSILKNIVEAEERKNLEMGTQAIAYPFEDLDVSFPTEAGSPATGTWFRNKGFFYGLNYGNPGEKTLYPYATDLDWNIELAFNPAGKLSCSSYRKAKDCQFLFPHAKEGTYNRFAGGDCYSGKYCYVEE